MRRVLCLIFIVSKLSAACPDSSEKMDGEVFSQIGKRVDQLERIVCDLDQSTGETLPIQNHFVQLVIQKNSVCDDLSKTFMNYFMQKRLERSDPFLERKLVALHGIIYLIGQIKESQDRTHLMKLKREIASYKKLILSPRQKLKLDYKKAPRRAKPRYQNY